MDKKRLKNGQIFDNEEMILQGKGKVTAEIAKVFAESEFEKYRAIQDKEYQSDFDKLLEKISD